MNQFQPTPKLLLLGLTVLSLFSCEPDPAPPVIPSEIHMGDTSNMIVYPQNLYADWFGAELDVNGDSIVDLEIYRNTGNPADQSLEMFPQNDLRLHGVVGVDTFYTFNATYTDSSTTPPTYYQIEKRTCTWEDLPATWLNVTESKEAKNRFKMHVLNQGDRLSIQDPFESKSFQIYRRWYDIAMWDNTSGGLNVTHVDIWDFACVNFPFDREYYLGFTIVEDGQEKLGWLKVKYSGADSITIIESAVQNF